MTKKTSRHLWLLLLFSFSSLCATEPSTSVKKNRDSIITAADIFTVLNIWLLDYKNPAVLQAINALSALDKGLSTLSNFFPQGFGGKITPFDEQVTAHSDKTTAEKAISSSIEKISKFGQCFINSLTINNNILMLLNAHRIAQIPRPVQLGNKVRLTALGVIGGPLFRVWATHSKSKTTKALCNAVGMGIRTIQSYFLWHEQKKRLDLADDLRIE